MSIDVSRFNESQKEAYNAPIQNVIVSAGAGSGKTTVLVARVIRQIIEENISPSSFLVVTYTKDAANNMKNEIKKEIIQKGNLNDLLPYVDASHIETIDAFRLFLVKKYASYLSIENDVSVIEEDVLKVETYKIMDNVLNDYYSTPNELMDELIKYYIKNDDDALKNFIYQILNEFDFNQNKKDFISFYSNTILNIENDEYIFNSLISIINELKEIHENLRGDKVYTVIEDKCSLLFKAKSFKDILLGIKSYNENKSRLNGDDKETTQKFREKMKQLTEIIEFDIEAFFTYDLPLQQRLIPFILKITYEIFEKVNLFKKLKGVYNFKDIEYLSNKLLDENPKICEELHKEFKVVMIDEYQDTSDSSNRFLSKIANNNLFAVGDIKQSIYGFNNANPEVFKCTLNNFKSDKNAIYIPININYRSRESVINEVNRIFEGLMSENVGGANYKDKENQLVYKDNKTYDNIKIDNNDQGLYYFVSNEVDTDIDEDKYKDYSELDDIVEKSEIKNDQVKKSAFTLAIEQIKMTAENIKKRVGKASVTSKDSTRLCTYKDFAILCRASKNFDLYRKIFSEYGIPLTVLKEENIREDDSVRVITSIVSIISLLYKKEDSSSTFKHYFVSIARSFLCEYNDNKIYHLLQNDNYKNDNLFKKLCLITEKCVNMSLSDIYTLILQEFSFIDKLTHIGNAIKSLTKLELLHDKIKSMDSIEYRIDDLKYYLEMINKLDLKMSVRLNGDSQNAVTLQTIHGSKGLQYNIVYFPELEKSFKFNTNHINGMSSYYINKKYGCYLPMISHNKNKTFFISKIANIEERKSVISEEMRLFYVALTRAKECGIIVLGNELGETMDNILNCKSYYDFLRFKDLHLKGDYYNTLIYNDKAKKIDKVNTLNIELKSKKIEYKEINYAKASKNIKSSLNEDILLLGTHYHFIMQCINFKNKDLSFINDKDEREIFKKVIENDIFKDIDNQTKIYKEYHFIDNNKNVEGIIDLLIIYNDEIKIIDYKLKNINDEEYIEQLNIYKEYITSKFKMNTNCYLLSLLDNTVKKI